MEQDESSVNSDDAYAEDDLPDLVLDAAKHESNSSLDGNPEEANSVIDLLLSMTNGRKSVSNVDISRWVDAADEEIDNFDGEEVHAEKNASSGGYKVTYTNMNKAYVPKLSSADIYRSYLSLMPGDDDEDDNAKEMSSQLSEERLKILAHFQTLSGAEQETQRKNWTDELILVEEEIANLKAQLGAKLSRRNHLRFLLGMEIFRKVKGDVTKAAKRSLSQLKDFIAPIPRPTSAENNNAEPSSSMQKKE